MGFITSSGVALEFAKLRPHFGRVERGREEDIRMPFWDAGDRLPITQDWLDIVDSKRHLLPGELYAYEVSEMEAIGPISIMEPLSKRLPGIRGYYDRQWPEVPDLGYADDLFLEGNGRGRLRPLLPEVAVARMRLNTNSGLPDFTKRSRVVEESLALIRADSWFGMPAVLFWRGTASGLLLLPKQRTVWGFPFATNIEEFCFFVVLFAMLRSNRWASAWRGDEAVDLSVARLLDNAAEWDSYVYSTDFSSFDQTMGPPQLRDTSRVFAKAFQPQYADRITRIFDNIATIPLVCTEDIIFQGEHGMPSGTVMTGAGDSCWHRKAQGYVGRNSELSEWCQCLGDDGLLLLKDGDLDVVLEDYLRLGLIGSDEKTHVGKSDCYYLRKYHVRGIQAGMYPTFRALNSLLSMERFHPGWGEKEFSLRAIMILEGCKANPLHFDLIEFTLRGDKYRLGTLGSGSLESFFDDELIERAYQTVAFNPRFNTDLDVRGLRSFETYKYLKDKYG